MNGLSASVHLVAYDISSATGSSLQLNLLVTSNTIDESNTGGDNEDGDNLEDVTNDNDTKHLPTKEDDSDNIQQEVDRDMFTFSSVSMFQ